MSLVGPSAPVPSFLSTTRDSAALSTALRREKAALKEAAEMFKKNKDLEEKVKDLQVRLQKKEAPAIKT